MNYSKLIENILDTYNITFWTSGKNVSRDSINVQCPFCDDHSNHLGIFKNSLLFNCWKCRTKGHLSYLLTKITNLSESEAEEVIEDEKNDLGFETEDSEEEEETERESVSPLPKYFEQITEEMEYPLLTRYLKRRKLTLDFVMGKGCGICRVGKYMNRMIIPVRFGGRQVSFVAADMTGTAIHRYENAGNTINQYLYNYDALENDIIVVAEGVLDAWRIGDEAVAIFGSYLTDKQKSLILKKEPECLVFCLDGDAYWKARNEAEFFEPYINLVRTIKMDFDQDPDSLGTKEIWRKIDKTIC